ncbi:hypothetical protein SSX86_017276 [Deinandra increscens subsp. villosa]|uniref:non-specific serine/threonine protein kinase n=1 Tax=Deinandra increscens subsp. villosa TaxID=3103831 RepID=A0AAP0GVI5_9ASTR
MQLPPLPWLLLLLLLLLVHLSSSSFIHPASSQSSFIYHGFNSPASTNLTLTGIARVTPNGILKLTNVSSHQIGRGFYPDPIRFKNPDSQNDVVSFSTAFAFSIHPKFQKLGGHGLAFTVSPTKDFPGAQPSQFLGLLNVTLNGNTSNHLFAVELDTVQDLEFSDIDNNHVGVDINRMKSVNATPAGFFVDGNSTKLPLCLHSGRMIQAWIDYDGSNRQLDITLSGFVRQNKPATPIMSIPIDLSAVFHDEMFVGFSSSTGVLTSSHYVFGWSFNTTGKAKSLDHDLLPSLQPLKKKNKGFVIKFSTSLILAVFIVVISGGAYVIKKFKTKEVVESWELDLGPRPFSYKELKDATKGFNEKHLLGFGGSGTVYKGVLPDSKAEIAVKRISGKSKQGQKEFLSEVLTVGRLRHRSLVPLLGWSRNKGELLLVYDFMANGSLDKYIYSDNDPKMILTWGQRFKIINDISNGLLYLHEEWEQTVVHRDIKAGNVLLDSDLNGRLGDFGLAKLYDHGSNVATTTRVVGTLGYLAPELTRTGKPTTSSDVYAFGALLLEVVCGRRPVELKALPEELIGGETGAYSRSWTRG